MSEHNTLYAGWLERITKDTKGKEKREPLWSILKKNGFIFFFTDKSAHTQETHTGKLPINSNTVFARKEDEEKKYGGYVFTIFARDKNIESKIKFKTNKKSSMEEWRGYINILGKDRIPPDLDLPTDCIHDMEFILTELRRSKREPDGHESVRTNLSRDSGVPQDILSSVTVTSQRTSASGGSGGSGGSTSLSNGERGGKRHKFSNNPEGDDIYPSWFISNCSREKALSIFTAVGLTYGNTLMRESAQSASQGTYVITYCSRMKDRVPVCDHFKVIRTRLGFRIDVDTDHGDMTNLTAVMMFFIKLNGPERTRALTTNDLNLLGLKESAYSTYLPKQDQSPRNSVVTSPNRETRERKMSEPTTPQYREPERKKTEPPPGNHSRRDYDYEPPVMSTPRPKTVTGATIQNEMRRYNVEHTNTKETAHRNRGLHPDMSGSHTVAPMRKGSRSELPPQSRVSMPDPMQLQKHPRQAVSWQKDFHVHPQVISSPHVQRQETPPPPCEAHAVLGYENDRPGFDKGSPEKTMVDASHDIPPPNYKAPAPPPVMPTEVKGPLKAPPPSYKTPEKPLPSHVTTENAKIVGGAEISPQPPQTPSPSHVSSKGTKKSSRVPPSFKPPQMPPAHHAETSAPVPASGIPAPPPPPPPPVLGAGGAPSKSTDSKSSKGLITGRKVRLSSGDYDDVARRLHNARRPTAPNIWGMPDGRERMMKLRSQSVPNLENQLKAVQLTTNPTSDHLNKIVTTSIIQRHPPKSIKTSASFDSGSDRSEAKAIEPGVDESRPGGVGTLSKKFGNEIANAKKVTAYPRHRLPADQTSPRASPCSNSGHLQRNQMVKEDVYVNDQMDEIQAKQDMGNLYINETPSFTEPIEYVNTRPESKTTNSNSATASSVDTSSSPSVEALKKKLKLEQVLLPPGGGLPKPPKVTSPEVPRNKRDIPLPEIPVENDKADEIYDYLEES